MIHHMNQKQDFDSRVDSYEAWFLENNLIFQSEVSAIQRLLPTSGTGVEIGVGSGLFASALGIKEGVEPSAKMRQKAIERGINVCEGVAEKLPISTGTYDFAIMVTVDCFLSDVAQAFKETWRVLVDDGFLIIAFIDRDTFLGKKYEQKKQTSLSYKNAHFHSSQEIKKYLSLAGFAVIQELQTVFSLDNELQTIRQGTGEGLFGVIKAKKLQLPGDC